MKKVIVIGVPRSGTTLLASMLGGHPDISMMDECKTWDWDNKQVGTKYVGNKIACDGITIHLDRKRVPIWGAIVNRLMNLRRKQQIRRWSPLYNYSIRELASKKPKVIIVVRWRQNVVESIMERSNTSRRLAERKHDKGIKLIGDFVNCGVDAYVCSYQDVVGRTDMVLKDVCKFLDIPPYLSWMRDGSQHNLRYGRKV